MRRLRPMLLREGARNAARATTILVVICLLLPLLGSGVAQSRPPRAAVELSRTCPVCKHALEPGWRYCPWCGQRVQAASPSRPAPDRDPWQTVLAFFEAYGESDRQTMEEVLDLQSILSDWIAESMESWEGVPRDLRTMMKRDAVPRMAGAVTPIVLDILTSKQMLEAFPARVNISYELLRQSYYLDQTGDRASLNMAGLVKQSEIADFAAQRILLRRKDNHWVITRMPFFGQ